MSSENDDSSMTPEERLAWLREHGVQVTTAEERKSSQLRQVLSSSDEFFYVCVPCDASQPLQELTAPAATTGGDVLVEHLQPKFASGTADLSLLQQPQMIASGETPTVSDQALQQVAAQASVEVFTLVHPSPANNFTAVHLYLDEVGLLKRKPLNARASDLARRCGFEPPPQFYGDVYLGRLRQHRNLSFFLRDTYPDAEWMQTATMNNLQHQLERNKLTGQSNARQPSVPGSDGHAAHGDGYSWTQTEQELEVHVRLPLDALARELQVQFRPQSLKVLRQGHGEVISLPALFEKVDVDGCTWTLESSSDFRKLIITMDKMEEALWPRILD